MSVTQDVQNHLPPVDAVCPEGHRTSVQAPSGRRIKCGKCREAGRTVMVRVPPRPGEVPAPEPRAPAAPPAAPAAECRTCHGTAPCPPGVRVPHGWLTAQISADPARDPRRRTRVALGPWCSARCAATALAARAGARRPPGPDDGAVNYRNLMTQRPGGRAS